ncbi:Fatty acid desaturase [Candidatus Filomicrobium marinum]|uniref:Fatty acid desaturase n=2 Tax=Filomicrobium TaxID=119044 RepID=A0A0D6JD66_9HYPH|nr:MULTISPECIES: fatty acid desaturase [Filomicrobium]MCV0370482.1 fatty acid desaturase [Filomicrobium sp.]CFX08695.1 Fatty acid desaturase [Candidatus Filomicrobium marinum]CPR16831.1 Fatty acid desaturase [Candidatus Filomicrobium marinum]SDO44217.1 Fatty acid desaturase [Filomicrobium insigne]
MSTSPAIATDNPRATGRRYSSEEIQALKARDNVTNFRYIAGIYAVIIGTAVITIWAYQSYAAGALAFAWLIPITILAVLAMGASQHQLGGVIHEGTHYILFADRKLNELASDWLGGFPIYTSTQAYRLHHFAHHQFVNDPDRDPIATQAAESGHWLDFPVTHMELAKGFFRLVWPVNLLKYMVSRAKHSAMPQDSNPFSDGDHVASPLATQIGILFAVGVPLVMVGLVAFGYYAAAAIFLGVTWIAMVAYYAFIPESHFPRSRVRPVISDRATIIGRMSYLAVVYGALTLAEYLTGAPAWGYYGLLWILPLFTTFPIFMVLREWVQHGNADRGRLTNSRVFLVDPISRYAVFPLGMDYHLPHHLFASVPHYKLKDLHSLLLRDPEYAEKGRIVKGWTGVSREGNPSIVEVLGPEYAIHGDDIFINESTLEDAEIKDAARIKEHVEASQRGRVW